MTEHILGIAAGILASQGGALTASEITQQGSVWGQVAQLVASQRPSLSAFLTPLLARPDLRIILTGAGTSAFIGGCLLPPLLQRLGRRVEAIATTDLVAAPSLYLQQDAPTLLVSFARSGSSPESVAAVALADQLVRQVYHLIITCNGDGLLYQHAQGQANALVIVLPDATHDRGFAMTSSFTSMLLTAALVFGVIEGINPGPGPGAGTGVGLGAAQQAATDLLESGLPLLNQLVDRRFKRVVYLGSNELKGLAQEAALKLLELSDGKVVAMFDTPLGFRHGPKTIIDSDTLVVLMMSNDAHTRRYDHDLLRELRADARAGQVLALTARDDVAAGGGDHVLLRHAEQCSDLELALPYVVFAQVFAFLYSLALGIRPDTPSISGTVNRVVSGVNIYPFG
jgi:tagatose-6-phosphate ketose/aldose isomerase